MMGIAQEMPHYVWEDARGFAMNCAVPNALVGGLIGRGGENAKAVQNRTGATIRIREIPGDPDHRTMNVSGPLAAVCAGYMLMMQKYLDVEAESQPRGSPTVPLKPVTVREKGDSKGDSKSGRKGDSKSGRKGDSKGDRKGDRR